MMKIFRVWVALIGLLVFLNGCAAVRKAKAGSILSSMKFSIQGWSLVSATVDSALFPKVSKAVNSPFPNPHILKMATELMQGKSDLNLGTAFVRSHVVVDNPGTDTIWIGHLKGSIRLDTLVKANWRADSVYQISPGRSQVPVDLEIPLDSRLIRIMQADSMYVTGEVFAYLKKGDEEIRFEFSEKRPSPKDEIRAFAENSKKTILDALLNGWARSIM